MKNHPNDHIREVLKYMVVEAPWGATTDTFLAQINAELGNALESLVPKAFETQENAGGNAAHLRNLEDVKKE